MILKIALFFNIFSKNRVIFKKKKITLFPKSRDSENRVIFQYFFKKSRYFQKKNHVISKITVFFKITLFPKSQYFSKSRYF